MGLTLEEEDKVALACGDIDPISLLPIVPQSLGLSLAPKRVFSNLFLNYVNCEN